jgi:cytochrome c peroxidase
MRITSPILSIFLCTAPAIADPVTDSSYRPVNLDEARLGQLLFYDPILSGNKNIACATCHHPKFATGDGVSLNLGEGGIGLGPERKPDPANMPEKRIPRHSPSLFNLGAHEFSVMFHDGRIEVDPEKPSGFRTPLDEEMLDGFVSLLSAQTMFPVLSADEMAGHFSENDISKAVRTGRITGDGGAWEKLSQRVQLIPEYSNKFISIYDKVNLPEDIEFTDISNAIAAFIEFEWRSDNSPYDDYLRGQVDLSDNASKGLQVFEKNCASCHAGAFQTDHSFHAVGMMQFGPGKAATFESHARDLGRMRVTGDDKDRYAFRTPSLRNAANTAPYGHTGAYPTLQSFLKAHIDPLNALSSYDKSLPILPEFQADDWWAMNDPNELNEIAKSNSLGPIDLTQNEISDLISFLKTLSDPVALKGRLGIPESVPSGLPIDR